jgi:hypothetical protein
MREKLIKEYVVALGGADRVSPIQVTDIERAVDLALLARDMRVAVRQGSAKVADLVRLEGALSRVVRSLHLPEPGAAPVMDLHGHAAKRALERANPQPTAEEAD